MATIPPISGKQVTVGYKEIGKIKFSDQQKDAITNFIKNLSKIPTDEKLNEFLRNRAYSINIEENDSSVTFLATLDWYQDTSYMSKWRIRFFF